MSDKKIQIYINAKDNASAPIKEVEKSTKGLSGAFSSLGGRITGALTEAMRTVYNFKNYIIAAFSAIGLYSIKTAGDFEQWNIAFETMLGSKEKATSLMNQLITLSKSTPFNTKEVVELSKQLLAMGIEASNIIPTMTNLGNIASGVGKDKLGQLTLAFGQVRAAGHLTGMELRQFTEAGVPLIEELAKKFNKSTGAIQEMVHAGKVGFDDVNQALSNMTNGQGKFANLMERQSKSFLGVWSNLKDQMDLIAKSIGDGIIDVFKSSLSSLQSSLSGIDLSELRYNIGVFLLDIKTRFSLTAEIIKAIFTAPFKFETYKGIMLETLQGIYDFGVAIKNGLNGIKEYLKKSGEEEEKDRKTLTQKLIDIHAQEIRERKKLEDEYRKRRKEERDGNVSLEGAQIQKITTLHEESENKKAKASKDTAEKLAKEKHDAIEKSGASEIEAFENSIKYDNLTTDQKIRSIQNFLATHKTGIKITIEQEKSLNQEIEALQKSRVIKQQQIFLQAGRKIEKDYKGSIADMVDNTIFAEDGVVRKTQDGLKGAIGDSTASFLSGAIGGVVSGGITSVLTSVFDSLFGGKTQKSFEEMYKDNWGRLSKKATEEIDSIGKEKSEVEKKIDVLDKLRDMYGGNSAIPIQYSSNLGLEAGTTVDEGYKTIYQQLDSVNNKDSKSKQNSYNDIFQQLTNEIASTDKGKTFKDLPEIMNITNEFQAIRWGGTEKAAKIKALYEMFLKLQDELRPNSEFNLNEILDKLNLEQKRVALGITTNANGGIIPGNSYAGDRVIARVNSGEMILNQQQQSTLFNFIASGGAGNSSQPITINVSVQLNQKELGRAITDTLNLQKAGLL